MKRLAKKCYLALVTGHTEWDERQARGFARSRRGRSVASSFWRATFLSTGKASTLIERRGVAPR
eukprot:6149624-Pleurochrysis_carterae.AAC.1